MATRLSKLLIAAPALLIIIGIRSLAAQIATDGTVGPRVRLDGPDFQIGAELGTRAGRNLFHSFERFSLKTGERATFSGPNQIRNVISRVTGGARSNIDGTLRSTIPGADFYFLNPAGIAFGPNARLDLQGSFHVSTADELRFADGAKFSATKPAASSFTVAAPEAFGFLGGEPGRIAVEKSILEVPSGEALSLVGGDVSITGGQEGFILAEAGTVNLLAIGSDGQAHVRRGDVSAGERADITLTDQAFIVASGDGGGTIRIRGGAIVVDGGSRVFANNTGARNSRGGLEVDGQSIQMHGGAGLTANVRNADAAAPASGRGGVVRVRAGSLEISGGSEIGASTFAEGDAGRVTVTAGALEVREIGLIGSTSTGGGDAGTVQVRADRLALLAGGQIVSSPVGESAGAGGEVRVTTSDSLLIAGVSTGGTPSGIFASAEGARRATKSAGDVMVTAGALEIRDGGLIDGSTFTAGDAGRVTVRADQLKIDGAGEEDEDFTGVRSSTFAGGDAGSVTVRGDRVRITGGGGRGEVGIASVADISIEDDGQVVVSKGNAGSVTVVGGAMEIRSAGVVSSSTRGKGHAGEVTVIADSLLIDGEGARFVTGVNSDASTAVTADGQLLAVGQGDAGSVTVAAGDIELRNVGQIRSITFGPGDAGDIVVSADRLLIRGAGPRSSPTGILSGAERSVTGVVGQGDAGSLRVTATELEILNSGRVSSSAAGQGVAGDVVVVADELKTDGGAISTDSAAGGGGEIRLLVKDFIDLRRSAVTTSVAGGADSTAGNILIDPRIVVIDGSVIKADSGGFGGRVTIIADNILVPGGDFEALVDRGDISASGGTPERAGTVAVNSPVVDLSGGLVVLEGALLDATAQLRPRCGARRGIGASSFTGVGRGGLPPSPDGPLVAAYAVGEAAVGAVQKDGSRLITVKVPTDVRLSGLSAPCAPLN